LDIGPKPDGTIPEAQEKVLREIGAWLKTNGEAIYGTRPWIVNGGGPTQEGGGKNSESDVKYQEGDVRFTRKGKIIYIFSMVAPTKPLEVSLLGKTQAPGITVKEVSLLGSTETLKWDRTDGALILPVPDQSGESPVVYQVLLEGSVMGGLKIEPNSTGFTAKAIIQNYGSEETAPEITLLVNRKKVSSQLARVGALSTSLIEIPYETSRAGVYKVSLSAAGQAALSGQAILPAIDLSGEWLFSKGDDATWSKPKLVDSPWQKVKVPSQWSDLGYKCENCFGWYRKHLVVPAEWKGHSIVVPLGKIDDADVSYWNGIKIGQTGEFPPKFQGFWDKPRKYEVPAKLIHFGKDNVISIRVYNGSGGAGLYEGPLGPIEVK
jgi:hypothetical protein